MGWKGKGGTAQKEEKRKSKTPRIRIRLGWGYSRGNMLRPSLENGKGAHSVVLGNFKQQEDVKIYSQLPDYDDFQVYYLGGGWEF